VSKLIPKVDLRCSACGAPGSGSCHCGTAYIPAGEYAAKIAQKNPELSSRELADQIGVSQRTAARALQSAREPFGSSVVVGRDGKSYPATKPEGQTKPQVMRLYPATKPQEQTKPQVMRLYGDSDLKTAKSYFREGMAAYKQGLPREEWEELVTWVIEEMQRQRSVH
jgi:hypothetical protein